MHARPVRPHELRKIIILTVYGGTHSYLDTVTIDLHTRY